jgi:hypothetical protein
VRTLLGIRAACVEDIRDGAEEALPTRSKLGSPTPPTHAPKAGPNSATQPPTSNEVICAGQALGRQDNLILQAARGQTPRLGQKIAKTEHYKTPRRHPCAKHLVGLVPLIRLFMSTVLDVQLFLVSRGLGSFLSASLGGLWGLRLVALVVHLRLGRGFPAL